MPQATKNLIHALTNVITAIVARPGLAGSERGKHRHCSQQAHATATFQGVPIADGRVGFVGFVHVTAGRS